MPGGGVTRPETRGECGTQRPCPWVSCRYHLLLNVEVGRKEPPRLRVYHGESLTQTNPVPSAEHAEKWVDDTVDLLCSMSETCALDVVERNPDGLEETEIAKVFDVTKQAISLTLIESQGVLRHNEALAEINEIWDPGQTL